MAGNSIGNEGCVALATALTTNQSLTVLDLRRNLIGDEGARALADALGGGHNDTLQQLDVHHNQFSEFGIEALDAMLQSLPASFKYLGPRPEGCCARRCQIS